MTSAIIPEAVIAGQTEGLPSSPARGLKLDPRKTLLYKFFLNSHDQVPIGLREVSRVSDRTIDKQNANKAIAQGNTRAAQDGMVRTGRVDTGGAVYQNIERVGIGSIRSLLALRAYKLLDAHFFVKRGRGQKARDQFVVVLTLGAEGSPIALSEETVESLRELARESSWSANFWDNQDTQTLNFTRRAKGVKPLVKTVFRTGYIMLLNTEGEDVATVEAHEDVMAADEIESLLRSFKKQIG